MKKNDQQLIIGNINVMDKTFDFSTCILNEKNTWITKEYITGLFSKYCNKTFIPTDIQMDIFRQATVHDSYVKRSKDYYLDGKISKFIFHKDHKNTLNLIDKSNIDKAIPLQESTYQRLEYVGDGLLRGYLGFYLHNRYEGMSEGLMTTVRGKIEDGTKLAELCRIIGLNKYAIISRFMELNNNRITNNSLLEDIFEAFIAAIVISTKDHNLGYLFVESVIKKEIHVNELLYKNDNNKDKLLKLFHSLNKPNPYYKQLSKIGNTYCCCVVEETPDGESICATGYGQTKKEAEQNAAKDGLITFGYKENSDSEIESDDEE